MRAGWRVRTLLAVLGASALAGEAPFRFDATALPPRAFDDATPIALDVDRDGVLDRLVPRGLQLRRRFIPGAPRFAAGETELYLALSLETAAGRSLSTLLQFRYGTENGGYRAYRLAPLGDANGDGRADLAFQVGGELPEETLILLDRGDRFEARSSGPLRCACGLDADLNLVRREPSLPERVLGRWDAARERFLGEEVVWVIGARAAVRDRVDATGRIVIEVEGGTAIRRLPVEPPESRPPGWLAVAVDGTRGWISERVVAPHSPAEAD